MNFDTWAARPTRFKLQSIDFAVRVVFFPTTMETHPLNIRIRYKGDDVDSGTMPVDEVITALQGFAGAYGKVANELIPSSTHELRVSAIREGSFELAILAWVGLGQAQQTFDAVRRVTDGARYVFRIVKSVIEAKKHIKSKPFKVSVTGNHNTTIVINAEGASMELPSEALQILQSKLLDVDLGRIASPLSEGAVECAEMIADDNGELLEASISSNDKGFFSPEASPETSQETEISGILISLNKETLRGTFKRNDGHKVPYKYIGENTESFYSGFSYKGIVRVSCLAFFDEDLNLKRLEITKVLRLQTELQFPND